MNPSSTLRVRRATAGLFLAWAVGAIVLSLAALRAPGDRLYHPFTHTRLATTSVIHEVAPSARDSGAEPGDIIVAMNGRPYHEVLRAGVRDLDPAHPNTYLLEKKDGRRIEVTLAPEPIAWTQTASAAALHALLVLAAAFYLLTGGAAWWLKSDRSEAWALLLFCCTMAAQLATIPQTNLIPLGWPRMLLNVPLIGATTFHLFTTYPIEPGWVVRHRRAQFLPYAAAVCLAAFSLTEREFGTPIGLGLTLSYAFTDLLMVSSLAIVAFERRAHGDGPLRDRADLMFWAGLVTFGPILLIYLAEWMLQMAFPSHAALLWLSLFPVAV